MDLEIENKPYPDQIFWGYDFNNKDTPKGSATTYRYKSAQVRINNLEPETKYIMYIIGGSSHPGFPDLQPVKHMKMIRLKTLPREVFHLDINTGNSLFV